METPQGALPARRRGWLGPLAGPRVEGVARPTVLPAGSGEGTGGARGQDNVHTHVQSKDGACVLGGAFRHVCVYGKTLN